MKNHIELLDVVAGNADVLERYKIAYKNLVDIRKEISDITERASESERLREILQYQINDIDSVAPYENEEDDLIDKKVKIKNSEKITKMAYIINGNVDLRNYLDPYFDNIDDALSFILSDLESLKENTTKANIGAYKNKNTKNK